MLIHFQHTELVAVSPQQLFAVLTDYQAYPASNPQVVSAQIVGEQENAVEVEAQRKTLIGKRVRFTDTYAPKPLLQFIRRYAGRDTAKSTWTVEPAFGGQAYFTIEAEMTVPFVQGVFQRPLLKRMFYRLNFSPFIRAAQGSSKRETRQAS
jgi:ribosome-associated toxin RatA of RatAB toxin-antitoxin module